MNLDTMKITCNACGTQIITELKNSVLHCPVCNRVFYNSFDEAPFKRLFESLQQIGQNKGFIFELTKKEAQ